MTIKIIDYPEKSKRTEWLKDAKWGLFFHYLPHVASSCNAKGMTIDIWNDRINKFNVEALADQLAVYQVKYVFITIGQCSGYYLAPNEKYDDIVGKENSGCSQRDLINDLSEALSLRNIRLLVYLPLKGPEMDKTAARRLGFISKEECPQVDAEMLLEFHKKWQDIIEQWSSNWGKKIAGWWIDCCFNPEWFSRKNTKVNFSTLTTAMRTGNSDSIITFASGECLYPDSLCEYEDYTAGEFNGLLPVGFLKRPLDFKLNGRQGHLLSFIGDYWGHGEPRFSPDFVKYYTREVNLRDFTITWDVPLTELGLIKSQYLPHIQNLIQV